MTQDDANALLRSARTEDRIRAVQLLTRTARPAGQNSLLRALCDRSNYVASLAATVLGESADETAADAMLSRFDYLTQDGLRRDPGCHIRTNLAFAFGRLEHRPAADALRLGIRTVQIEPVGGVPADTAIPLRANCALALAQIRVPECIRDIAVLLFDRGEPAIQGGGGFVSLSAEPRKAAAKALAMTADPAALVPLAIMLTYPGPELGEVLQECMQSVVDLKDPRALELLQPYLEHGDPALAAYAAVMVARTQDENAPLLLRETIERLDGNALRAVVLALVTIRSAASAEVVKEIAHHGREAVRLAAVEALAVAQDPAGLDELRRLARDDRSSAVRAAAERSLVGD